MEQHNPVFEKIPLSVTNPFSENLRRLAALFPSIVKDGQVDFDALKEELGEFEEVDKERYELTWAGKQEAKRTAGEPVIGRTLKYVPEESKDPESTENLYIEGDNLEVLKLLQNAYIGKIKMIYIDPPYNTGEDRLYKDTFNQTDDESAKGEGLIGEDGERFAINPKTSAKYHTKWLSMMYPRLRLARNLLSDDGVIFISISDIEVGNLREICDEIFGGDNFLANICHKARASVSNDKIISESHNHVLFYAKSELILYDIRHKIGLDPNLDGFSLLDEKGAYKLNPVDGPGGAKKGNPHYTFMGIDGYWRYSEEKMLEKYNNGEILVNKNSIQQKYYLEKAKNSRKTDTTWWDNNLLTSNATKDLINLLGRNCFDSPKNINLIIRMLISHTYFDKKALILDFFSGSSTTAHAVMQFNAEDGGNRKFIMVQYPEQLDETEKKVKENKAAIDFCDSLGVPRNICEIGKERIRRAGDKIQKEHPEASPDTGFNVFRLADTNIRWIAAETGQVSLEDALITSGKDLRDFMPGYTDKDVVYEILLRQYDIPLTAKIESLGEIGKRTYSVAGTLIVCLEESITNEIIDKIAAIEPVPHKIIFRDSAFADDITLKENTMMRLDALMQKHSSGGKTPYRVEFL